MDLKTYILSAMIAMTISTNANQVREFMFKSYGWKDVTWNSDVVFDVTTASKLHCFMKCSYESSCLTFTFTSGSNRCQGHSKIMANEDNPENTSGTSVYHGKVIFTLYESIFIQLHRAPFLHFMYYMDCKEIFPSPFNSRIHIRYALFKNSSDLKL